LRFMFMSVPFQKRVYSCFSATVVLFALILTCGARQEAFAQTEDAFSDASADPVRLFERGQNAHARGELLKAIEFYDEALKVRPEFAEAEFQRGNALVSLGRLSEAEAGFRRAIELKKDWSLPYAALGSLLVTLKRDADAESYLRLAIKSDSESNLALRLLGDLRLRAGDAKEALELLRRATTNKEAPLGTWVVLAIAERASGNNTAALASLDYVLQLEPANLAALIERAELRMATGNKEGAIQDVVAAEASSKGDKASASRLVTVYELAGKSDEARRLAQSAGFVEIVQASPDGTIKVTATPEEIAAANNEDSEISRKALESLVQKNPGNAMLLARLGDSYRKIDPGRSLDYYRRAIEIEPHNAEYATGYSSALVQARRFADAVIVLRRVISIAPNNYTAHANLATALYALKQYALALEQYQWLLSRKPDLTIAHYFIATAHDNLGEYQQALAAYESFLALASPQTNELEIEKVKLRLPLLRRQIQLGQGVKKPKRQASKQR
jgi:tetratricopeptide (TPR) repeat protein